MKEQNEAAARVRERFLRASREYDMFACASVAIALSGGADSVTLLHLMKEEADRRDIALSAIHINHMIRADEADRDEEFCRELCEKLAIPLFIRRIDVPALAKASSKGLEEAARDARYEAFDNIMRENNIERIATAHNSDDNAETVLFSLFRGSSGINGIPPVRDRIIRPLIFCEKSDIIEYCISEGLSFVYDKTNGDETYTRNFIRHEMIPLAKRINPRALDAISRACALSRRDEEALGKEAASLADRSYSERCASPDAVLSRYLIDEYKRSGYGKGELCFEHIEALVSFYRHAGRSERLSLPGGTDCVKTIDGITFEPTRKDALSFDVALGEGENDVAGIWKIKVERSCDKIPQTDARKNRRGENVYKFSIYAALSSATIHGELRARTRRAGDSVFYGGHTHKLKKLLQESSLTVSERDAIPVIEDDEGILFVPGFPERNCKKSQECEEYTIITVTKS